MCFSARLLRDDGEVGGRRRRWLRRICRSENRCSMAKCFVTWTSKFYFLKTGSGFCGGVTFLTVLMFTYLVARSCKRTFIYRNRSFSIVFLWLLTDRSTCCTGNIYTKDPSTHARHQYYGPRLNTSICAFSRLALVKLSLFSSGRHS